jgi:hypothetical protein
MTACPTALTFIEICSRASEDYFQITERLVTLIGQHYQFAQIKSNCERVLQKCRDARLALEEHRALHGCGLGYSWSPDSRWGFIQGVFVKVRKTATQTPNSIG